MSESRRVVFDCNVFLQALANPDGPAGRCLQMAIAGRVTLYVSPIVLDEIAKVTRYPKLVAKLRMSRVSALLENLNQFAITLQGVPELWRYDRDPGDAHYINLALAADARLVVH